ncbi:MAG: VOC family protein [Phycisphaeraceae bacterium]|nr:MAG: VOC family protein [Phycisphaeraceae bacterium]
MTTVLADKIEMQHRLFGELSRMFGAEVPLYDKSLAVNRECNRVVCAVLAMVFPGFTITDGQIERTSGERHGAIRIGTAEEYRWVCRFFAAFGMEPHNYYDMTSVGSKSQPIVATAYRSTLNPEHRVFTSLLRTDYFDSKTRERIEGVLATRRVFSDRAKALIEKGEREGGLAWTDAEALIGEGTGRIFKWTGRAKDHALYKDLCDAGFKIAADIACFERHHLNHLTPNTFCMDLYTSAMKFCMGEIGEESFRGRAATALERLASRADWHTMRLLFRHLSREEIDGFGRGGAGGPAIAGLVDGLTARLRREDLDLTRLKHSGFKDFTEGPSEDTPVLLRQDAYKALTEPVQFMNADGSETVTTHTARFGEIEQRFYATTASGRTLYDRCLAEADAAREKDPGLPKRDFAAYERAYAAPFGAFPKTVEGLVSGGLIHARYWATPKGVAARGTLGTADLEELVKRGFVRYEGLRYEDFLPVSAAGIFASNLNQYGTQSTAAQRPTYTRGMLEEILGRSIIDTDAVYRGLEASSRAEVFEALGLTDRVGPGRMQELRREASVLGG